MNLKQGIINSTYTIRAMEMPANLGKRLAALGMIPGTRVTVLNKKERGAVIIKVRGTRFAIGGEIAGSILVGGNKP